MMGSDSPGAAIFIALGRPEPHGAGHYPQSPKPRPAADNIPPPGRTLHHAVQGGKLLAQCIARLQHRRYHGEKPWPVCQQFGHATGERYGCDRADFEVKSLQGATDVIIDDKLRCEQCLAVGQQQAQLLAVVGLDVHSGIPAHPDRLGDCPSIVAIGLDRHGGCGSFMRRVSMHTAPRPAPRRPSYSQGDSGPASSPMR
jgi:hypothetical protein